jgi:hypothetical protein
VPFTAPYVRVEIGVDDVDRATGEADRLLAALHQSPRLGALARNPFLLSAFSLIHRAEGRLPRHRVQAYQLFARALCETWTEARRLVASTANDATLAYEEEALPILGELAYAMHTRYPTGAAPEGFVLQTLAGALAERQGVSGPEAAHAARAPWLRAFPRARSDLRAWNEAAAKRLGEPTRGDPAEQREGVLGALSLAHPTRAREIFMVGRCSTRGVRSTRYRRSTCERDEPGVPAAPAASARLLPVRSRGTSPQAGSTAADPGSRRRVQANPSVSVATAPAGAALLTIW